MKKRKKESSQKKEKRIQTKKNRPPHSPSGKQELIRPYSEFDLTIERERENFCTFGKSVCSNLL
jgi:hypothetical protein